jgi:hypothetical protein
MTLIKRSENQVSDDDQSKDPIGGDGPFEESEFVIPSDSKPKSEPKPSWHDMDYLAHGE